MGLPLGARHIQSQVLGLLYFFKVLYHICLTVFLRIFFKYTQLLGKKLLIPKHFGRLKLKS